MFGKTEQRSTTGNHSDSGATGDKRVFGSEQLGNGEELSC